MRSQSRRVLITDLDNTLWDWFAAWHASFSTLLDRLVETSGVSQEQLEFEIRRVHQRRGTAEYSLLLDELPSLRQSPGQPSPRVAYDDALHAQNKARKEATKLYPGVLATLERLRDKGMTVVAYTESIAFWTEWRIRHTGLDGVIDVLYSAPDHEFPSGVTRDDVRYRPHGEYGLRDTKHLHVPRGATKPNASVMTSILSSVGAEPEDAAYVGDSLMKDVAMAQQVGVLDIHAKYGEAHHLADYGLLQRVSHWTDEDVRREQSLRTNREIRPTHVLSNGFDELLGLLP